MTTATLTTHEQEALPDWDVMQSVSEREFKIHDVTPEQELFWIEDSRSMYISISVQHVDPDSAIGEYISELCAGGFITMSAKRLDPGDGKIPGWFVTEVHEVRPPRGTERNAFGE
jgi:hypothetical protein